MSGFRGDLAYDGEESIILCFDIGATRSAVSYVHLSPGTPPTTFMVTRWPGQVDPSGASKIPSILAYEGGECISCGEEALELEGQDNIEIARWFKLHLHPPSMRNGALFEGYPGEDASMFEIPSLPTNVSVDQVYEDFISYLFKHTQVHFEEHIADGPAIWNRLRRKIHIVLTIPNGWDLLQQHILRNVVVAAGIVAFEDANTLLSFISESEASIHFSLAYGGSTAWVKPGTVFACVDVGGSTCDSTLYECTAVEPKLELEEACSSVSIQAGGIYVDRAARKMLERKLAGSQRYGDESTIQEMTNVFESKTKRLFDGSDVASTIHFGRAVDNDDQYNIHKGKLSLTKQEVAETFEPAIQRIILNCVELIRDRTIDYILLVGGFGESKYLRSRLESHFASQGIQIVTAEQPSRKAAAEGAAIWYFTQHVTARAAKYTYGALACRFYDPNVHSAREANAFIDTDGELSIRGCFDAWVRKDTILNKDYEYVHPYVRLWEWDADMQEQLQTFSFPILAFSGNEVPAWGLTEDEEDLVYGMHFLCIVQTDLRSLSSCIQFEERPDGKVYYRVEFAIVLQMGGTHLTAKLRWYEGGQRHEGPASILPDALK